MWILSQRDGRRPGSAAAIDKDDPHAIAWTVTSQRRGEIAVVVDSAAGYVLQLVVLIEPGEIEQVILNLVLNARDALAGNGTLLLRTCGVTLDAAYARAHSGIEPGEYVLLTVEDTGEGMDEATRQRAFEPFFTTKGEARGSGLGLSTIYGIVRQAGGTVWLYSEPGLGTTVKVYLPRVDVPALEAAPPAPRPRREPRTGGTVLVVEDDELLRSLIEVTLAHRGYRVLSAGGGDEAIALFEDRHGDIDLIVSDVVMPGMRGPELAARLREHTPGLRVVFMSGYTGDRVDLADVPPDAYFIEKPFSPDALAQTVDDALAAAGRRT
jgi:CheY-like chemotaxis protein